MKFVSNAGTDRVLDLVRPWLKADNGLDMVSPTLSLFAFAEVLGDAAKLANARVVLPAGQVEGNDELGLLGSAKDRAARNKLQGPWLARNWRRGWSRKATCGRQRAAFHKEHWSCAIPAAPRNRPYSVHSRSAPKAWA
jgi:hypothetical protein